MKKNINLFLALAWTLLFIAEVILCISGSDPTWGLVFCPLAVVCVNAWCDYIRSRKK